MSATFEIYRRGDTYRWRLDTDSHLLAAFGTGKQSKDAALQDIDSVKKMISEAVVLDQSGDA